MSARLLALCCLLIPVASMAWSDTIPSPGSEVVVYLKSDSAQPPRPLEHMKVELRALMRSPGYRVEWREGRTAERDVENAALVVVELRGSCGLPQGPLAAVPAWHIDSLASTHVSNDNVLPFSWVNCENLTLLLAPALSTEAGAQRDYLYGRAMARLVAHELYHVLANSRDHCREGIAKAGFTVKDLLSERFDFTDGALGVTLQPTRVPQSRNRVESTR
jgi:hypothetical protein